jgi:hypothetical protein
MRRNAILLLSAALVAGVTGSTSAHASAPKALSRAPAPSKVPITLVTGDVAWLTTAANGSHAWQFQPAAGDAHPSFQHFMVAGDDYVLPSAAAPYVESGKLDVSLFDVTALARSSYDDTKHPALPLTLDYGSSAKAGARQVAVNEPRATAAQFWQSLTAGAPARTAALADGLRSIRLAASIGAKLLVHTAPRDQANVSVTVNLIGRDGGPGVLNGLVFFTDLATGNLYFGSASSPTSLPPSTYLINTDLTDPADPAGGESDDVLIVQPETVISADTTITLDARQAHEITVQPPQRDAVGVFGTNAYTFLRTFGSTTQGFDYSFFAPTRIFTVGTGPVADGTLNFATAWTFGSKALDIRAGSLDLGPVQYPQFSPEFNGLSTATLVYAGAGHIADFAKLDVRGKVAVVQQTAGVLPGEQAMNAARAGASGLLIVAANPGPAYIYAGRPLIPVVGVPQQQGTALKALLASGPASAFIQGVSQSPYRDELLYPVSGQIPAGASYQATPDQLATVVNQFDYATPSTGQALEYEGCGTALDPYLADFEWLNPLDLPSTQVEYVTARPDTFCTRTIAPPNSPTGVVRPDTGYQPGATIIEPWLHGPIAPGAVSPYGSVTRTGDTFDFTDISEWNDQTHFSYADDGPAPVVTLARDGVVLATGNLLQTAWNAVPDATPAVYQLTDDVRRTLTGWTTSTATHTAWTFNSATPAAGVSAPLPLLVTRYDLPSLDQRNRARAGIPVPLRLTITPQAQAGTTAAQSAKVWFSTDDGTTWHAVPTAPLGSAGSFGAIIPAVSAGTGTGYVSLRVQGADNAGNQIDQTVIRAYAIAP